MSDERRFSLSIPITCAMLPSGAQQMIEYFPVAGALTDRCTFAYSFVSPGVELRLPAMLPQIQVQMSGQTIYRPRGQPPVVSKGAMVVGVTSACLDLETTAGGIVVGVGLLPSGWRSIIGRPADTFADRIVEAIEIWPASAVERLQDQVASAQSPREAIRALEVFLIERTAFDAAADLHASAIDDWIGQPGPASIDSLIDRLDLSLRQIERLTRATYGASPKVIELKYRTLRVAHQLAISNQPIAPPGDCEGFYDQSHLINNFQRFVGTTPRRFHIEQRAIARHLLVERWRAGARTSLALWG